jgi:GntR family histidine utilization transcriptional repressor
MRQSQNRRIKDHIHDQIERGALKVGDRIASESRLAEEFGVSRMTVNRALRELEMEGRITRVQGVGSFVARRMPQAPLFEVQSIRAEIESRGAAHSCTVLVLEARPATERAARRMEVPVGSELYYLEALHLSDGAPLQVERRWVRPGIANAFLQQDFARETASDYLLRTVRYTALEHTVSAILPDEATAARLDLAPGAPCLQLTRKTMIGDAVITDVDLIHPGHLFRLQGRMSLTDARAQVAS